MLVTARNPAYTMEPRQVVVIGAGIAGISAAIQLQHAGYRVTILVRGCVCFSFSFSFRVSLTVPPTRRVQEARERAGGRIKTMKKEMKGSKSSHLSIAIELGASFIKYARPDACVCVVNETDALAVHQGCGGQPDRAAVRVPGPSHAAGAGRALFALRPLRPHRAQARRAAGPVKVLYPAHRATHC